MKHLIIYAHPDAASLNAQFKDMIEAHLNLNQHEVIVRDLYALNFNPVLTRADMEGQRRGAVGQDIVQEQQLIRWADRIIFIHPIWWTGLPAIIKGYIDRVFSYGFAYRYDQGVQIGLLKGKEAVVINTHGKSKAQYQAMGMDKALSLTSDTGIYTYCGFTLKQHFFFDQADRTDAKQVAVWKRQILELF